MSVTGWPDTFPAFTQAVASSIFPIYCVHEPTASPHRAHAHAHALQPPIQCHKNIHTYTHTHIHTDTDTYTNHSHDHVRHQVHVSGHSVIGRAGLNALLFSALLFTTLVWNSYMLSVRCCCFSNEIFLPLSYSSYPLLSKYSAGQQNYTINFWKYVM